jgi:hypothetical protein
VYRLQVELDDLQRKAADAARQWEASANLVEQFKTSLTKAEEDCVALLEDCNTPAVLGNLPTNPIAKMYLSNVKKFSSYATCKVELEERVERLTTSLQGCSRRLTVLLAHLEELRGGEDAVVMHPEPLANSDVDILNMGDAPVLPSVPMCYICKDRFPHSDILLCSCLHVYHLWYVAQWFKSNASCAVRACGLKHPFWYRSWGFGDYEDILARTEEKVIGGSTVTVIRDEFLGDGIRTS